MFSGLTAIPRKATPLRVKTAYLNSEIGVRPQKRRIGGMFAAPECWSALAAIVVIGLVLAGDNAIVIALAARNLPKAVQRRAILWGTVGAVGVRASLTVAVLWLLEVLGVMGAGGVLL